MSTSKSIKKVALLALSFLLLISCSKYDEGPMMSLRSRSERVANIWEVNKATSNGEDVTSSFSHYELQLSKDGDAELDAEYLIFGQTFKTSTDGTWEFINENENLSLDLEGDDWDVTYQILKLTEHEMKLREMGGDLELTLQTK